MKNPDQWNKYRCIISIQLLFPFGFTKILKKVLTPYPSKMKVAYPQKSIRPFKTKQNFEIEKYITHIFLEKRLHLQRQVYFSYCSFLLYNSRIFCILFDFVFRDWNNAWLLIMYHFNFTLYWSRTNPVLMLNLFLKGKHLSVTKIHNQSSGTYFILGIYKTSRHS